MNWFQIKITVNQICVKLLTLRKKEKESIVCEKEKLIENENDLKIYTG